jgi:hypothetical protein
VLQSARKSLRAAEGELAKSMTTFQGHREKALELTRAAVREISAGLEAAK